ncbi:MAG TPA: helix-turn-helix transcriptional regulator [Opitutaceae bacterium]|jgi:transcriptional regulator with XRE-family HTH domain
MGVLEIIAERRLGAKELASHPRLRAALERVEQSTRRVDVDEDEKARITSIVDLCFAYERETDPEEKMNILRTLEEISANEPLELPSETVDQWEAQLNSTDAAFAKESEKADHRMKLFLRKYFSLRGKAGFETQAAVAEKTGLSRSYVAVIESGEHFPQQKTLQKLARAFGVDVADLLP